MLENSKRIVKYYEPIKGLDANGKETVCCLVKSLTAEEAIMVERTKRYDLSLSDEVLLNEFMIHNWAWFERTARE